MTSNHRDGNKTMIKLHSVVGPVETRVENKRFHFLRHSVAVFRKVTLVCRINVP